MGFTEKLEKNILKKEKLEAIRNYHRELIKDLDISDSDFNMKYKYVDGDLKYVKIFENEFKKEKGFFFELINGDLDPIDSKRTVYRLAPSIYFHEEFENVPVIINGVEKIQYIVPIEQLMIVNPSAVAISKSSAVTSSDEILKKSPKVSTQKVVNNERFALPLEHDAPFNEMTIRDYMAIHTGRPVSLKGWLNDLIKFSK